MKENIKSQRKTSKRARKPVLCPEHILALLLKENGLNGFVTQFKWHPERRFRADFCWHDIKLIVEVDGGTWIKGGHSSGSGIEKDYERDAEAILLGYRVLRFTTKQVNNGYAIGILKKLFN